LIFYLLLEVFLLADLLAFFPAVFLLEAAFLFGVDLRFGADRFAAFFDRFFAINIL